MNERIIKILKEEVNKAIRKNEVPVASLLTLNGKIIAKAYNKTVICSNPIYHAEILTIIKAAKKLKCWNLSQCVLYTTLKPCKMCEEVIKASRIKNVYYILESNKVANNKILYSKINFNNDDVYFKNKLQTFFKDKR